MASWTLLPALLFLLCSHCGGAARPARGVESSSSAVKFDFTPFRIEHKSSAVKRLMGSGVTFRDVTIDPATGVAARIYLPSFRASTKVPVLVYFHGGAFVSESAFSPVYHAYVSALVAKAGVVAVSVNYRLASENPLPAAFVDSWAALTWVLANAGTDQWLSRYGDLSRLFLAGDSSGGNIAHSLALRAGEEGLDGGAKIKGMALLDPYFLGWSAAAAARTSSFICTGNYPCANPLTMPTTSWQHLGCSRVLVTVAGQDRLGPRQRAYYSTLRSSGWVGQAELYETPGEGHVYFLTELSTPQAQAEMATLAAFINRD